MCIRDRSYAGFMLRNLVLFSKVKDEFTETWNLNTAAFRKNA